MSGTTAEGSSDYYYLCFRGVRRPERLLKVLLGITDLDILYVPGVLCVRIDDPGQADVLLSDPDVSEMDDSPDGYWLSELLDRSEFLDLIEASFHRMH